MVEQGEWAEGQDKVMVTALQVRVCACMISQAGCWVPAQQQQCHGEAC
jgi:hypothetical protein